MDISTPTAPARPRSGARRWGLRIAIALVVLAVLWSAASFYAPPLIAAQAEKAVAQQLGRRLTLGKVEFSPWTLELTINDLAVAGPADGAPPLLEVRRIHANVAAASLFQLAPVIDALEIDSPMLRVARVAEGRYDVDDILQRLAAAPQDAGAQDPARFALHNIVVRGGGADFSDQPLTTVHRVRELGLSVPFISSLPSARQIKVEPHLAFVLDGSRFDTAGAATPYAERGNGELRIKLSAFDVKPFLGYVPRGLPAQLRAATLAAELVVAFEQRPKLSLNITGSVAADGIEIVDPASQQLLKVGSVKLALDELRPLERMVRLRSVDVVAPHVFAVRDARGQVNLLLAGAPPSGAATPVAALPLPTSAASAASSAASSAAGPAATSDGWRASVAALSIQAGRLDWRDATVKPAAALALSDFSMAAQAIAWPLAAPVVFRGEGLLGSGTDRGKLAFSGQGSDKGAEVRVVLTELPLAPLQPYLRSVLTPPLNGALSAEIALNWQPGAGALQLKLHAKRLALARAVLGNAKLPELGAELVEIADAQIDTALHTATIGRLLLRVPRVRVERDAGRRWGFERWSAAADAPPQRASAAVPAGATPVWKVSLGELAIEQGRVAFSDLAGARPVTLDLVDLAVQLRGWALEGAAPALFHVAARVEGPLVSGGRAPGPGGLGKVDVRGELRQLAGGVPASAQATLLLQDLPLHLLDPYLDDVVNVDVQKAQTSFKGTARWEQREAGAIVALRGDLSIDDFRATSQAGAGGAPRRALAMVRDADTTPAGRQLLNWKTLSLRGIDLVMEPGAATRLSVAETALNDFYARVVLDETGKLNLQDVTRTAPAPAGAAAASPTAAIAASAPPRTGPAAIVTFGPIAVVNGRVAFNDRFVRPNYNANLSELTGRLAAFSSVPVGPGQPPQLADLSLQGRVEGTATLDITGKVNPLAQPLALDIQAKVRDLELPPLSPYAIKYAGYGIERGKMSVDLAYVVRPDGQLTASNRIVLNQLAFGDKVEGATASLPVKLAVALLTDRNGAIDLDLPVSGSINDPQFSLGGVIWKVVSNLIVRAVTAPFSLLASAFSGSSSEASSIEFEPGTAALTPAAKETLDKLAKALAERPAVSLTVTGESRLDLERDAWKRQRLQEFVRAEKRRRDLADGAGAKGEAVVTAEEYPTLLKDVYKRADIVKPKNLAGQAQDLPTQEMESLLLSNMVVADAAMQQLAVRRSVAVRDHLAGREIAAARLFLGAPRLAGDEVAWKPRAELKLAAD